MKQQKLRYLLSFMLIAALVQNASAQTTSVTVVRENEQVEFPDSVPAGNYSGIASLGGNYYAVVSDKSKTDGFFVFKMDFDQRSGQIKSVRNLGFRDAHKPNRDGEGIAYLPLRRTILISGEADNAIKEYNLDGTLTGKNVEVPAVFSKARPNYSLESLTFNETTGLLWTCSESTLYGDGSVATAVNKVRNRIRIQSFDSLMQAGKQYAYLMDAPEATTATDLYAIGVSEMTALDDGSLLVLEREFFTPPSRLGAFVSNKIYQVFPAQSTPVEADRPLSDDSPFMKKALLTKWHTYFSLLDFSIANYEGMCLGPKLPNGSQVIILLSDSQDQYGGVLKDWFKTIVVKKRTK